MIGYPMMFLFTYAVCVGLTFLFIDNDDNGPHAAI